MANGSKHNCNRTTAPLPYLLITVKVSNLEKIAFSDIQNPKTVNTLTADDKNYLLNTDNLTPPIQMKLSEEEKTSGFFFAFLKPLLNFQHLPNKDHPHS